MLAWIVAAALAVTVGVVAVTSVGASVRDRGPLGNDVPAVEQTEGASTPAPSAARVSRTVEDEFGAFDVACRGATAYGVAVDPAAGWRVVSYEQGPDDDVDAVFSDGRNSVDLEVFCNRGRPTLAELERNTLGED